MSTQEKDTPTRLPLQVGDRIAWTDKDGTEHEDEVRGWSDKRITCVLRGVPWDAKNLRVVPKPEQPAAAAAPTSPADATPHQPRDGETRTLPLCRIAPSPLNPRKTFHRETLEGLAQSIKETGLIQSLVVRPTEDWQVVSCRKSGVEGWTVHHSGFPTGHWDIREVYGPNWFPTREEAEAHCPQWELIAGERRFRASLLAGLAEVDCRIRTGLDDAAAYRMMIDENTEREEVNPIDEAHSLQQMLARGVSQRRLAEALGEKSQSRISRMASLVNLPESVQELGRAGKLQASHLERIARWAKWPKVCSAIGELAAEHRTPVRELEGGLPFGDALHARKLARRCSSFETAFDYTEIAAQPEHKDSFVKGAHGYLYCLDVALYDRLQKEGKKVKAAAEAAKLARELKKAGLAEGEQLPRLCDLAYGSYERRDENYHSTPSCDGKSCPCAGQAWDTYNRQVVQICRDPKRRAELRASDKAARENRERQTTDNLIDLVLKQLQESQEISGRDLFYFGSVGRASCVKAAAELLELDLDLSDSVTAEQLSGLSAVQVRNLFVLSRALHEQEERVRWKDAEHRLEWYLGIEEPAPEQSDAPAAPWPCQRCGEDIDDAPLLALQETIGERVFVTGEGGILLTAKGGAYCATCAPDVAICHLCGCTDEFGCDEGCDWLTSELCTACAKKLEQNRGEVSVACHDCGAALDPREGLLGVMRAGRLAHVCEGCKTAELEAARTGAAAEAGAVEVVTVSAELMEQLRRMNAGSEIKSQGQKRTTPSIPGVGLPDGLFAVTGGLSSGSGREEAYGHRLVPAAIYRGTPREYWERGTLGYEGVYVLFDQVRYVLTGRVTFVVAAAATAGAAP